MVGGLNLTEDRISTKETPGYCESTCQDIDCDMIRLVAESPSITNKYYSTKTKTIRTLIRAQSIAMSESCRALSMVKME